MTEPTEDALREGALPDGLDTHTAPDPATVVAATGPADDADAEEFDDLDDDDLDDDLEDDDDFEDDDEDFEDDGLDDDEDDVEAALTATDRPRRAHLVRRRSRTTAGRAGTNAGTNRKRPAGRWRRRASGALVLGISLSALGVGYAALGPSSGADSGSAQVKAGQAVYDNFCIACHGRNLQGVGGRAPSLLGVGQAAVYFQVATGRMPLARQEAQAQEKPPQLTEDQAQAVAAYIQSVGGGPQLPTLPAGQTLHDGDLAEGGELFRLNCAQCHNFAGQGGALSSGKHAPGLGEASDAIIYAAMLSGPENMPVFGDNQLTPDQKRSIIDYIQTLKAQKDPGGHGLGRLGPVPEGIVLWVLGVGVLVFMAMSIGAKS